jgi:hypothetical protein
MITGLVYAHADIFADPAKNTGLVKEIIRLSLYGLMGKEEHPALLDGIYPDKPATEST